MILSPFAPYLAEGTSYLTVTASAQTMTGISPSGIKTAYRCVNSGTATINLLATAVGAVVVAATLTTGMTMLPGTAEVFTLPPNVTLSVIGSATGSVFSITPGEGA